MSRILIVEDEELLRWSLRQKLEQAGHLVREAGSADQALSELSAADLVVLDWVLPDADGLTLLHRIREERAGCPVIMMTAHGAHRLEEASRGLGVRCVLDKPFDLDRMLVLVEEALAGAAP